MSTPEIIYLIPGEDIEGYPGMVWCESSAPSDHCDPEEAVKYVRADKYDYLAESEQRMISQMAEENERLQVRVAELERQAAQSSDDEDARFNQVVFLVDALRQSTHGKEVVEQASGNQIMDVELRDYLEDSGLLPVSCERLRSKADKAGGTDNAG